MDGNNIEDIVFEELEVEIKETYVDEDGNIKERIKMVRMPDFSKPPRIKYKGE